jgi:hypothetical protein
LTNLQRNLIAEDLFFAERLDRSPLPELALDVVYESILDEDIEKCNAIGSIYGLKEVGYFWGIF